jgi:hypothetical protein
LHEKTRRKQRLGGKAEDHPPIEPGDEDIDEIGADGVRKINEQE